MHNCGLPLHSAEVCCLQVDRRADTAILACRLVLLAHSGPASIIRGLWMWTMLNTTGMNADLRRQVMSLIHSHGIVVIVILCCRRLQLLADFTASG